MALIRSGPGVGPEPQGLNRPAVLTRAALILGCLILHAGGRAARAGTPIVDRPYVQEYHEPHPLAASPDVRAVALDRNGRLWAATGSGVFFLEAGRWGHPPGGEAIGPTFDVLIDAAGRVWVGGWDGLYEAATDRIGKVAATGAAIARFGAGAAAADERMILAAGPDGTWIFDGEAWRRIETRWADSIRAVALDADGRLRIATGVGLFLAELNSPEAPPRHFFHSDVLLSSNLLSLAWAPDGRLWIGGTGGIDVYDGEHRAASFTGREGLPHPHVRSMAFDAAGRLWAATALGVARFDGHRWTLRHSRRWVLSDDCRDVEIGPDGTAWIATAGGVSAIRPRRLTLAEKADLYLEIVRQRHVRPPGFVAETVLAGPGDFSSTFISDSDNDGLFTGLYCAMESFRYAVTGDPSAKAHAAEAFGALEFLQRVTGTPHFIARTAVPIATEPQADRNRTYTPAEIAQGRVEDARWKPVERRWRPSADGQWLWKGDTSSDELTGHMFAYATYHDLVAEGAERRRVAELVGKIIGGVVDHGFVLQDIDGTATRWGVWARERLNEDPDWRPERGVNSVEILSFLSVAARLTGQQRFVAARRELIERHGYAANTLKAKPTTPSELTHIDDQLLALSYPSLLAYETDPALRTVFQASLRQWHAVIARDHSPLFDFVFHRFSGETVPLDGAAEVLRDWPLDLVEWTVDNRSRADLEFDDTPGLERLLTRRRLPPSESGLIRWDRDPFEAVRGNGGRSESTGVAWLAAYWMGRFYGFITPPQED